MYEFSRYLNCSLTLSAGSYEHEIEVDGMKKNIGVYIHIPFCARKCAYCDFYSMQGSVGTALMPEYHKALLRHIAESAPQLRGYYIDTVYFGGGTPSFYGAGRLIELFEALKSTGSVLIDCEVTAEVNPDSVTKADLTKMRRAGFNRLSVGVQSTNDDMLRRLGRLHSFSQAEEAVVNARLAGFKNVSIDLMYGLPSQSRDDWADTLTRAAALKPDHISCYGLKLAEGTELYIFKDTPFIPDDDTQADMYLYAVEALSRFGYPQYEISNFARRGFESRHNMKYWRGEEYISFGAAAHSYVGGLRYNYIADAAEYTRRIMSGDPVVDQTEEITKREQASEYLMLGLRTVQGISEEEYRKIYPCSFELIEEKLEFCAKHGFAEKNDGRWSFTPRGFLVSNALIGEILEAQTQQRAIYAQALRPEQEATQITMSMFDKKQEEVPLFQGI